MTAGARAGNSKIEHLGSKNKGTHNAHQGDFARIVFLAYFFYGISSHNGAGCVHAECNGRAHQSIGHMHINLPPSMIFCAYFIIAYGVHFKSMHELR